MPKSKQLRKTGPWPAGAWHPVILAEGAWGLNHLQGRRAALRNVDGPNARPVKAAPGLLESPKPSCPGPCPAPPCGVPTASCQRSVRSRHRRLFQATVSPLLPIPSQVTWRPSPLSSPHSVGGSVTGRDALLCNGLFSQLRVPVDREFCRMNVGIYGDPGYS